MKIAVLGWGSLIWETGSLSITPEWHKDGPKLPVEFARVSSGDRLTLVLVDSAPIQMTLWTLSLKETLAEAVEDLRKREGPTKSENIGRWCKVQEADSHNASIVSAISDWAMRYELDGVVWTALGPKKPNGENGLATGDEFIDFLRGLAANGKDAAAREYIEKAPVQIYTPIRKSVVDELGWC